MTGKDAKYVHIHGKDAEPSKRDILLTGDNAEFVEITVDESIQAEGFFQGAVESIKTS